MALDIGSRKQVFIDWDLIEPGYGVAWGGVVTSWEMPHGVRLAVHPPRIDATPLVATDRPWETFINVYCTLFQDEGRFRLYYEPHYHPEQTQAEDLKAMLAYAESTDGVNWTKPEIGAVSFQGIRPTTWSLAWRRPSGAARMARPCFKDPSAPADERYKFVHMGRKTASLGVFGAMSPDGLHWTAIRQPLLTDYMSDTQTVVRFDSVKGRYIGVFRGWRGLIARQVARSPHHRLCRDGGLPQLADGRRRSSGRMRSTPPMPISTPTATPPGPAQPTLI